MDIWESAIPECKNLNFDEGSLFLMSESPHKVSRLDFNDWILGTPEELPQRDTELEECILGLSNSTL